MSTMSSQPENNDIRFRLATANDAALLFAWQQHPETRKYARNPSPPIWEQHLAWLEKTPVMVAERGGHAVGMLRIAGDGEISIIVAPGLRNQGIGMAMLTEMKRQFPQERFSAFINGANVASGRLFERAGFVPQFDGWWHYAAAA